jgi:hypothetical protein
VSLFVCFFCKVSWYSHTGSCLGRRLMFWHPPPGARRRAVRPGPGSGPPARGKPRCRGPAGATLRNLAPSRHSAKCSESVSAPPHIASGTGSHVAGTLAVTSGSQGLCPLRDQGSGISLRGQLLDRPGHCQRGQPESLGVPQWCIRVTGSRSRGTFQPTSTQWQPAQGAKPEILPRPAAVAQSPAFKVVCSCAHSDTRPWKSTRHISAPFFALAALRPIRRVRVGLGAAT